MTDSQNTRDQITSHNEGSNERDQIALYAFHSFLVEVQTNAGYILDPSAYGSGNARLTTYTRMRNNNPEIRIASCRPE